MRSLLLHYGMSTSVFVLVSLALLLPVASTPADSASEDEALALMSARCEADGGNADMCACSRETFRDKVLLTASTPEVGVLAARMHAGDAADPVETAELVQSADPSALTEAAHLISLAKPSLEVCMEVATEPEVDSAELSQGGSPRERFIRQCASEQDGSICACLADEILETLSPLEFELMVDLREAEGRGEEAIAALAEERGLTVEEAKQGLAQMAGPVASAMMSLDPLACVGNER